MKTTVRRFMALAALTLSLGVAQADYLELARSATLRAEPASHSAALAHLDAGTQLVLIDDKQNNGYYHVRFKSTGQEGWIYRTFGRRYAGNPADNPETSGATAPAASVIASNPSEADYAVPSTRAWGKTTKNTGCQSANGLPDAACTPGDILPDEDEKVVCSAGFHTSSIRNHATSQAQKNGVYPAYGIPHPARNTGSTQVCEIDHLVSLELGGADTIANLWPECSPGYANWQGPGFRDKDGFENYLWFHVCVNQDISLKTAQIEIASNWRTFWELAGKPECRNRNKCE